MAVADPARQRPVPGVCASGGGGAWPGALSTRPPDGRPSPPAAPAVLPRRDADRGSRLAPPLASVEIGIGAELALLEGLPPLGGHQALELVSEARMGHDLDGRRG